MNLKLSKTAIRELTRLYRGVLVAAIVATTVASTGAKAADVTAAAAHGADDTWAAGDVIGAVDLSGYTTTTDLEAGYVAKVAGKGLSTNDFTDALKTKAENAIDKSVSDLTNYTTTTDLEAGYVAKVAGKGLSTEDYTSAEKTKLAGIAEGAQVNVIESVKVNGTALTPDSKAVDILIAEGTTDGTIKVNGTDVTVHGLGTMAYETAADYKVKDTGDGLTNTSGTISVKANTDGTITVDEDGVKVNKIGFGNINSSSIQDGTTASDKLTTKSYVDEGLATKQDKLVIAADSGLKLTGTDTLSVLAGAGMEVGTSGVGIKAAGIVSDMIKDKNVTTAKIDDKAVTSTKLDDNAVTTDKINAGAVTFAKLNESGVYSTTVGAGSDTLLATTSAVKSYADTAVSDAITAAIKNDTTNHVVTLKGSGTAQDVYDKTGTANYVTANAENANYTGKLVDGTTSAGSIKAALQDTNTQVKANKDAIGTANYGTGATILTSSTATGTVYGDLAVLSANAAGKALANTFTQLNTFEAGISVGTASNVLVNADGTIKAKGKITSVGLDAGDGDIETDGAVNAGTLNVAGKFAVDANGAVNAANGNFTVDKDGAVSAANGNFAITKEGNTTAKGTLDVTGATTLKDALSVTGLSTLTGGLTFDGTDTATALDNGGTAVTGDGVATTLATTKTLMTSAENAKFTVDASTNKNVTSSDTTLNKAITALDTSIGDRNSYTKQYNIAKNEAVAASLEKLDLVIGDMKNVGNANGNLGGADIAADLKTIDANMGNITAFTGSTTGNISNSKPGAGTNATNIADAIANIDATLGQIHGLKDVSDLGDKSNLAAGTTVKQHLVSLDNAIGDLTQLAESNYMQDSTSVADAMMSVDRSLNNVEKRVNKMHHEMKSGFASLAAMSALVPNARVAGDTQIAVGTGYYRGTTGFAVGAFHHINDNVLLNAGASYGGNGAAVFKGGVTFGF